MDRMNMTPEDVRDMKMRRRTDRAYNQSLTSTEAAPAQAPQAPKAEPKRSPMVEEAIQEMRDQKARKRISDMGYKAGGKVGSASKRADGCAQRGKTKGKMI